jgi:hypothetical protein
MPNADAARLMRAADVMDAADPADATVAEDPVDPADAAADAAALAEVSPPSPSICFPTATALSSPSREDIVLNYRKIPA